MKKQIIPAKKPRREIGFHPREQTLSYRVRKR
jgi:hypothetical protein